MFLSKPPWNHQKTRGFLIISGGTHLPYKWINPFHASIAFYIETSHLIYIANLMTGFYMKYITGLRWAKMLPLEI